MSRRPRRERQRRSKPTRTTLDLRDLGTLGKLDNPPGAPGADVAQEMARILRQKGIMPQSAIHVDAPHTPRGLYELERWQSLMDGVVGRFPRLKDWSDRLMGQYRFELHEVFSGVAVTGWVQEGGSKYAVYVQRSDLDPPAGCNCDDSGGARPCRHGRAFATFVSNSLSDRTSELARRVQALQFDPGQLRLKDFEPDKSAAFAKMLERISPPAVEDVLVDDDTLPTVETLPAQRIAWNFHLPSAFDSWEFECYLQTARKRSDGWTKGKKFGLEQLGSYSHLLTPRDARVRALVSASRRTIYSAYEWSVPVGDALIELVGACNVMLKGEPATVKLFDAALTVRREGNFCSFALAERGDSDSGDVVVLKNNVVMCAHTPSHCIYVKKLTEVQSHAFSTLMALPQMPIKLWDQMVKKLTSFQHVLNVQLPDGHAVEIEKDIAKPVVLLRSRDDGTLDYGMRVRLTNHKLVKPSEGPLRWLVEKEGKSIQYVRDAESERIVVEDLLATLGLPAGQHHGMIRDFELALKVIEQLQSLQADGVETLWDKASSQSIKVLGTVSSKNVSVNVAGKRDWFQIYGTCNLGDRSIDLSDLLASLEDHVVAEGAEYIRVRNEGWARISGRLRKQLWELRESLNQERNIWKIDATSAPAVRNLLGSDIPVAADASWHECLARLERAEKLDPALPFGINAELRDYQLDGYKWLRRLAEWRVGGVLADDMGLGKTLQTLAVIVDRMDEGPALVIAPTSVAFNWQRESERFAPGLLVHAYRETDRSEFLERVGPGDLVVCSYGLALRDAKKLAGVTWATMVLDEAQAIKNSRSKTSMAIAAIPAHWRVALTGTPVENHLGELWSLFHVISPGVFGGWEQFRKRFAVPIERDNDEERRGALRDRLRPFILRRTKSQVLTDLPPRTESNVYVELSPSERAAYDAVRLAALGEIAEISDLPDIQDQRFKLLALLTRLRQLACSPRMVQDHWEERSSKLLTLLDHVRELREEGHRVLVFSQFVQHLSLIREMFDDEQITYEYLDGSTPAADRQKCVDRFQNGDATAFLISLKAGGTGLNLTAADYVIHMDPWWNPAVEDQATDRAHRIGQDKPVMVYRMIAQGTIEEEILKLHDSKRDLVAGIMEGAAASAKLSTHELVQLIRGT